MTQSPLPALLAIDGGGTRCRLALEWAGRVFRVESGPANASSDFNGALEQIRLGLAQLGKAAGLTLAQLGEVPAFLGLAGVVSPKIAERLEQALPFVRVRIADDRPAALRGALGAGDGAIAHCGTGSFLASQIQGRNRIIGGWGQHLGDEASAQWLGRLALARTLNVCDGLEPGTGLSTRLLTQFSSPAAIVAFAAQASPLEFGALARTVTSQAKTGDALAENLMRQGASYLADTLPRIGWAPGHALCLTGGLAPEYRNYLPRQMQQALQEPLGDPLSGALALARQFAIQPLPPSAPASGQQDD